MENEILSWAYWGSDKSEIIRNFALALAALIGVPFLIWRTFATHKSAKAALTRSMASLKQSEASLKQAEISNKQAEAALEQSKAVQKQTQLLVKNQFLEYLIKGFDQLSNENPSVRLGAIYILERLATESEQDRHCIMNALKLYVESTAKFSSSDYLKSLGLDINSKVNISPEIKEELKYLMPESERAWPPASPDIQAIMEVLGGEIRTGILGKNFISFRGTNLRGIKLFGLDFSDCSFNYSDLSGVKASGANFKEANLAGCILVGANFYEANLKKSNLSLSQLIGANLKNANLIQANLSHANLERAKLNSANLTNAVLDQTNLSGTDLTEVVGLTQTQLNKAHGDSKTLLPKGLTIMYK